jgi:hypothetical protein
LLADPAACRRMGAAARAAAEHEYAWEFLAARLEPFYTEVRERARHA